MVGHVARIEDRKDVHRVLLGRPERSRLLVKLGVDGMIILKWIFKIWMAYMKTPEVPFQ